MEVVEKDEKQISLLQKAIEDKEKEIAALRKELEEMWDDADKGKLDNTPFDVPMVDEEEDEFAFLKNAQRKAHLEDGEYDILRCILKEEQVEGEEANLEEMEFALIELQGGNPDEF